MRVSSVFIFASLFCVDALGADAVLPRANWVFVGLTEDDRCADEATLKQMVASHLGHDAFDAESERTVYVRFAKRGQVRQARVELLDANDQVLGTRVLDSTDCAELSAAAAFAIAVAIDPQVLAPKKNAAPAHTAPLDAEIAQTPKATSAPSEKRLTRFRVGAGVMMPLGAGPSIVGFAVALHVGLRHRAFSTHLEGRFDVPIARNSVESTLSLGGVSLCGHLRWFFGCGLGYLGALSGHGVDVSNARTVTTFYSMLGARLAAQIPLTQRLRLVVLGDFLVPLTPTELALGTQTKWRSPPVSGALGVSL